jgi:hypothetical protein
MKKEYIKYQEVREIKNKEYVKGWNDARDKIYCNKLTEFVQMVNNRNDDWSKGVKDAINSFRINNEVPYLMCKCGSPTHPLYGCRCEDCYAMGTM